MHVHVSALDGLIIGAFVIIWLFLLRLAAVSWSDRPIGRALAFIH